MKTGFIGAGAYATCPVDDCEWKLNTDQSGGFRIQIKTPTPEGINEGISVAAMERGKEIERVLREHLESHDVLDFLRTIHRLNNDLTQVDCGIRPHVYRPGADTSRLLDAVAPPRVWETGDVFGSER